jgi:hypothetical protein
MKISPFRPAMFPVRAKSHNRLANRNANTRHKICGQGCPRNFPQIAVAFGCPPEMQDTFLLLKTLCISDTEPREPELDLTWILPPPWGLAFMVPEGIIQSCKREKQPIDLFSYNTCESQWLTWHVYLGQHQVIQLNVKSPQGRRKSSLTGNLATTQHREVMEFGGKAINCHFTKWTSILPNYTLNIYLYTHREV